MHFRGYWVIIAAPAASVAASATMLCPGQRYGTVRSDKTPTALTTKNPRAIAGSMLDATSAAICDSRSAQASG